MVTTEFLTHGQLEDKYGGRDALYEKMLTGEIEQADIVDVWNKCAGREFANWAEIHNLPEAAILAAARDLPEVVPHIKWLFGQGPNPRGE